MLSPVVPNSTTDRHEAPVTPLVAAEGSRRAEATEPTSQAAPPASPPPASTLRRAILPLRWAASFLPPPLRRGLRALAGIAPPPPPLPAKLPGIASYADWVAECDTLTDEDRVRIRGHIDRFASLPLISVVLPVYETPPELLREAIQSVRHQLYPNWELCIADDASPSPHVGQFLEREAAADHRIRWIRRERNGHISEASNTALSIARGDFVVLLDHDDILAQQALYEVAAVVDRHPDADIIFSDEDRIDEQGRRLLPYFKPGWDPELLLGQNCVSHLGVYRRSLLTEIGGFRPGLEGSQDHDLTLRASARTRADRIHHIPAVLYHWRLRGDESFSQTQLQRCIDAAHRAIKDHLATLPEGQGAIVAPNPSAPSYHRITWPLPETLPKVSVLIPTRNRAGLLAACTSGLLNRTDYGNLEVLVIDNGSDEPEALSLLEDLRGDLRVRVLVIDRPFNYAALNNEAAREAAGEILLLLNNDVEVIEPGWLKELVSHALRPGVGTVGAKLVYGNGSIQHAGIVLGIGDSDGGPGIAAHFAEGDLEDNLGYFQHSALTRSVSANTGACLAIRREVFLSAGGFDEQNLPVEYNDVDLCLRLGESGLRHVWTPFAKLFHHERSSRGDDLSPAGRARSIGENRYMRKRWGQVLDSDPYYNANFSRLRQRYELCRPARRIAPWRLTPGSGPG
jgi:glycosyltransferase involved in cell wall biosynthesis